MAMVMGAMFTHIPMAATLVIAIGAVVLGTFVAFAYGWVAVLVGATSTFLLVRYVARDYLQHVLYCFSPRLRAFDDRLTRNGFLTVFGLRLVLGLAPLLDWGLGVTGVRTWDYIAATALGVVPNIAVAVFFADVIAHRRPGSEPFLAIALISLLVVAVAATLTMSRPARCGRACGRTSR
jgi:uncharacterized membrane protein YdjX (TVP38/TMEM64 family)